MRRITLVQLPIPPLGPEPIRGNVPLAAGYLKMFAEHLGLGRDWDIQIFPSALANALGDQALVEALLRTQSDIIGFSCYLWNIERTLWLAERLKQRQPQVRILLGGPEITLDNAWVLEHPAVDWCVIGEGEATFADLLRELRDCHDLVRPVAGLWTRPLRERRRCLPVAGGADLTGDFQPRQPLAKLDVVSSPYLAGILDVAEEQMMFLETLRGCVFKCKFCYYPKSYETLHWVSEEKVLANLEHARQRGAREVVLLDPTLNQGRNFDAFVELLIRGNPERQFTYFGELRAEGITAKTARLLRQANFTEVEIGLQSIDPQTMELMDRKNNLRAVERGIAALRGEGIHVKIDLIIGLPGDTVDSVRRSFDYVLGKRLYDDVQVFNLAVLPGTAFRHEAAELGLIYQPRPPYYVRHTPTLSQSDLFTLMAEAQEVFAMDWDPLPPPRLPTIDRITGLSLRRMGGTSVAQACLVELDGAGPQCLPPAATRAQAFTLWLRAEQWARHRESACSIIHQVLTEGPFTTLQIVLEPRGRAMDLPVTFLAELWSAAQARPSYLDKYFALQPGRPTGAKRLVVVLPWSRRNEIADDWLAEVSARASIVWRDAPDDAELGAEQYSLCIEEGAAS